MTKTPQHSPGENSDEYESSGGEGAAETIATDTDTLVEDIISTATWVQKTLNLEDEALSSIWYERIAETCYIAKDYETSRMWYGKAKAMPNCSWAVNQGLALAAAELSELEEPGEKKTELKECACNEMEAALASLREEWKEHKNHMPKQERGALVRSLKQLASWHDSPEGMDKSIALYEEAMEVDPHEHKSHCDLLGVLYDGDRKDDARQLLLRLMGQPDKPSGIPFFSTLFRDLTGDEDDEDNLQLMNIIVTLAQEDKALNQHIVEALEIAIQDAKRNEMTVNEGILLLYYGIMLARGKNDSVRLQRAIQSWGECHALYLPSEYDLMTTHSLAARYETLHHLIVATSDNVPAEEKKQHLEKLEKQVRVSAVWSHGYRPTSLLASYHVSQGRPDEARKLFKGDMIDALRILFDDDKDNDA